MARKGMKDAMGASIKAEEKAVKDRFEKADSILTGGRKKSVAEAPAVDESKVIRDSFTMPEADYELIEPLKKRCMKTGIGVNKSELLRAGLQALTRMSDSELTHLIGHLQRIKPGRRPK